MDKTQFIAHYHLFISWLFAVIACFIAEHFYNKAMKLKIDQQFALWKESVNEEKKDEKVL